jgi:hypothetical protein
MPKDTSLVSVKKNYLQMTVPQRNKEKPTIAAYACLEILLDIS